MAVLVLLFHAGVTPFKGGFIGVDIFFVLSGYLITSLLLSEFSFTGRISLRRFYIRRLLRLVPALLLLLAVFCAITWLDADPDTAKSNYRQSLWAVTYLSNWARAFQLDTVDYLGHTWSLAIEEQFYLIWPALVVVLLGFTRSERVVMGTALLLACAVWAWRVTMTLGGADADRLYNGLDTRADTLMWGCVLAVWARRVQLSECAPWVTQGIAILGACAAAGLLACGFVIEWWERSYYLLTTVLIAWLSAVVIFDLVSNPRSLIRRVFCWRTLVTLGVVSYGVYLWHWPIYYALYRHGVERIAIQGLATPAVAVMVMLSYWWVERPFLRLKTRFQGATSLRSNRDVDS